MVFELKFIRKTDLSRFLIGSNFTSYEISVVIHPKKSVYLCFYLNKAFVTGLSLYESFAGQITGQNDRNRKK